VALAPLINKLDNSDWVRQGRPFLPTASPRCPFCQQSVSHELTVQLSEYFDARYTDQLDELSRFGAKHDAMARRAREYIDKIKPLLLAQVDNDALELSLARLDKVLLQNERAIKNKLDQPSNIVKLEDLQAEMASVNALIDEANERTRSHNALVDNRAEAHQNLIRRCWRTFVRGVLVADITYYEARIGGLEAARESLQGKLHKKKDQEVADRDRLQKLQTQITSSQPIITKINGLLRSVGFLSFHLAESRAATDGYELVRADGTHASGTLSEGERTFITFLYFYHQLQGVQTDTSESPTLVAVIDDPISSLDSDILFVVSTLIRRLMGQIRKEERRVRQLILLTHNVHFQKEVTYIRSGEPSSGRHFFVVRKRAGQPSEVIPYLGKNPVRTVYKSLWDEVARAKSSPDESSVGLQNVMRRILENYFRVLGGIDDSVIISQFEGEQQIICRSLFSWINEGSHSIIEESEFSPSGMSIDAYLEVFEQIFTRSDNRGHYTMMMGVELEVPDGAIPIEVGQ
jgi:wobble nucleotide-excising tRNase